MFLIALKFLLFDKAKSFGALFGVIISVFLIGQQTGIFTFITSAMSRLVDTSDVDIWVVDDRTTNANALSPIDSRIERLVSSIPGVEIAAPMALVRSTAKFENGVSSGITLVGLKAPLFMGGPSEDLIKKGSMRSLIKNESVTADIFDSKALGGATYQTSFEISGKRAFISAQTRGVRGFGGGIYMFSTIERTRYYGNMPNDKISAVLVRLRSGVNVQEVVDNINNTIYGVRAWERDAFSKSTVSTVLATSGIAFAIGTLVIFAIISGVFIIGLTLYSSAVDRIKDYATFKAIGANNSFVSRLIFTQAITVAILGYVISSLFLEGFRNGIATTGTIFNYHPLLRLSFFLVTLMISILGSIFAIRRITKVEPATVFK